MGDRRRRVRGEEGQAIAELVIVAPVLLIIIVLMVALGRVDSAQGDVESAARAGVQAAVVQADAADGPNPGDRRGDQHPGRSRAHLSRSPDHDGHVELRGRRNGVGERDLCDQPGRRVGARYARLEDAVGHLRRPHRPVPNRRRWHMTVAIRSGQDHGGDCARRSDDGQFLAMTAVFMTMFLALAGLVADGGHYLDAKQAGSLRGRTGGPGRCRVAQCRRAPRRHHRR